MQINGRSLVRTGEFGANGVQRLRRPYNAMQQFTSQGSVVILGDSLLNTKEAARFLRVSEASIRRWSDAGLLPAHRVGRRRERRFAQADLRRFLGQPNADPLPAGRAAAITAVPVGGASVPLRSHLAPIYSTDAGGLRLSVPFLAAGLKAGQPCFLVATGAVLERYAKAMRDEHAIDLAAAAESGQLAILSGPGVNTGEAIGNWERLFGNALASGPTVLRVVGEMTCVRRMFASDADMMTFEEAFEIMAKRFPAVSLCQYDAREFDGAIMLRALKAHPDMFDQHLGAFLN
jgi:excisionase family DNA binding protein